MTTQMTRSAKPTQYDPTREVRLAVVIYGGISLAIYINGIVQEMLRWVRATASRSKTPADPPTLLYADGAGGTPALRGSELVYRKLAQILNDPDRPPAAVYAAMHEGSDEPVRTRFVIDILSGSSAGGINAVFLSKALAQPQPVEEPLKALEGLWIDQANIELLINDVGSLKHSANRLSLQNPPQALLNGERLYMQVLDALDAMDALSPEGEAALVEKLDLYCTATDLRGLRLQLPLTDAVVDEKRHRNVFHFQHDQDDSSVRDFVSKVNPFLAFAARSTSAFPFAFEPMTLDDIFPIVQTSPIHGRAEYANPETRAWERFYRDYVPSNGPAIGPLFHERAFGDGGDLDNKPFSFAIEATLARAADLPITRKLMYIEPEPERMRADSNERPDALENSFDALIGLPRYETIRQDLERVVQRNQEIERLGRILKSLEDGDLLKDAAPAPEVSGEKWVNAEDNAKRYGVGYAAYQRLKLSSITDDLTAIVADAFGVDLNGGYGRAIRILTGEWRDIEYPASEPRRLRRFALDFDLSYRLRRLRNVSTYITELHDRPRARGAENSAASEGSSPLYRQELRRLKSEIAAQYRRLRRIHSKRWTVAELLGATGDESRAEEFATQVRVLSELMDMVLNGPRTPADQEALAEREHGLAPTEAGMIARAKYVLTKRTCAAILDAMAKTLGSSFRHEFDGSRGALTVAFSKVEGLISAAERKGAALKGRAFAAFGGFFDETWRRSDILWGRLDGAERLIGVLLPGTDPENRKLRALLIDQAHEAIVREVFSADFEQHPEKNWKQILAEFVRIGVRKEPEALLLARSVTRSTAVIGKLLDDIAEKRRLASHAFSRLVFAARIAWGLVEVSVPHTLAELLFDYWLQLALIVSVVGVLLSSFYGPAKPLFGAALGMLAVFAVVVPLARSVVRRYVDAARLVPAGRSVIFTLALLVTLMVVLRWGGAHEQMLVLATGSVRRFFTSSVGPALPRWLDAGVAASVVAMTCGVVHVAWRARSPDAVQFLLARLRLARDWTDITRYAGTPGSGRRGRLASSVNASVRMATAYTAFLLFTAFAVLANERAGGWLIVVAALYAGSAALSNWHVSALLAPNPNRTASPISRWRFGPFAAASAMWGCIGVGLLLSALFLFSSR
jgi:patatin-related protein